MKIRHLALVSLGLVTLLQSEGAWGAYNVWEFRGTITVGNETGAYSVGSWYSLDFYVPDPLPSPVAPGLYYPTFYCAFNDHANGYVTGFAGGTTPGVGVLIANDQARSGGGCFDGIIFSTAGYQSTGFPSGARFDGSTGGITLVNDSPGSTAAPFADTSFPSALALDEFSQRYMTLYFTGLTLQGTVDSLYINGVLQVPEPSCIGLFICGGLLFGCKRLLRSHSVRRSSRTTGSL